MLKGKGTYIWKIKECEGGNIANIVTMCQNANFSHVIIKIAEGTVGYNYTQEDGDMAMKLANALEAVGIEAWGFQFIYSTYGSEAQAATAARRVSETGVLGFVINAESSFEGYYSQAQKYVDALQLDVPIALSSFRYPSVHKTFPWDEFLSICDLTMPQVYWMEAHNPAEQLKQCINEYAQMTDLPVVPTGSAFCEHGWCPTNADIIEFSDTAKMLGLPGINFWEWSNTRLNGFWKTVRDIDYPVGEPEQPVDCCEELWEAYHDLDDTIVELNGEYLLKFDNLGKDVERKTKINAEEIKISYNELEARLNVAGKEVVSNDTDIKQLFEQIEMLEKYTKELEQYVAVSFLMESEIEKKIEDVRKPLQDQIENLTIQCDHTHPAWMVKWGLVK